MSWTSGVGCGALAWANIEAAFRENAIDLSILPDLTDQDLEKIGVLLGHRRKLLRAIANLETQKASASTVATPATMDASPHDTAERRQVTVMFSDLVGSTALSARMDPEDQPIHRAPNRFQARWVNPMHVLENHQHRLGLRQRLQLRGKRLQRLLPPLLWV